MDKKYLGFKFCNIMIMGYEILGCLIFSSFFSFFIYKILLGFLWLLNENNIYKNIF